MKTYYKTAPGLIKSSISIALLNANYTQIDKVRPSLYFLFYNKLFSDHEKLVMFVFKKLESLIKLTLK